MELEEGLIKERKLRVLIQFPDSLQRSYCYIIQHWTVTLCPYTPHSLIDNKNNNRAHTDSESTSTVGDILRFCLPVTMFLLEDVGDD